MSNTSKVVVGVVILLLVIAGISKSMNKSQSAQETQNSAPIESSAQTQADSNTASNADTASASDSFSTSVDQDTQNVDAQMNTLNSDSAAANSSAQ